MASEKKLFKTVDRKFSELTPHQKKRWRLENPYVKPTLDTICQIPWRVNADGSSYDFNAPQKQPAATPTIEVIPVETKPQRRKDIFKSTARLSPLQQRSLDSLYSERFERRVINVSSLQAALSSPTLQVDTAKIEQAAWDAHTSGDCSCNGVSNAAALWKIARKTDLFNL